MISEAEWRRAVEAIEAAKKVVVACHINPDGDALGSMLGLGRLLARAGKSIQMGWGSGKLQIPPQYSFLPGLEDLTPADEIAPDADLFLAIDCASADRLGLLLAKFRSARTTIVIDHHISNDRFGDVNLIDPEKASSSELAYELITRLGGIPDADEATCLYTGIVTDTGRFQYASTSPETLRVAARLRELGVDHEKVANNVYESASFEYLHVLGLVLSRARLEDGLVWSWIDQDELGTLDLDETEHFIDALRAVAESKVAVLLKQLPQRTYKASLRSRGEIDVSSIAEEFGGGGHARAAGFESRGSPAELIEAIKNHIP